MKKLFFTGAILFMMGGLKAQSLAEARKLLYYERYDGAAHQLHFLLQGNIANAEAWLLLTQIYIHQKRIAALRDTLSKMPLDAREQPLGICAYGQLLLQEHQKDSAMDYFSRALKMTKEKDVPVLLAIARAQETADSTVANYTLALDVLNKALKRDKRDVDLYIAMGKIYRRLTDGTNSYKAYQDALAQDPHNAEALYRLGKIFVSQNNAEMYLKYFNDAVAADPLYSPAWYELYYHYYFRDVNKAMDHLNHFIAARDPGIENDYLLTDLLYASRKYQQALQKAQQLIGQQAGASEPRLYKLVAYSYKELHDSAKAFDYMQLYFQKQQDSAFVVKDYETMGEIYDALGKPDSAVAYYVRAGNLEKDSVEKIAYAKKLAGLYKRQKDFSNQALWLGKYYCGNERATNLDLFNWGLAHYMAKEYIVADSVFGLYETKYPDQDFGYYWRARCDAAIDTSMTTGMAIPQYMKLVEMDSKDSTNKINRKHLVEAYGYVAAYKANTEKDYAGAIGYFGKLLELDPGNADAQRYIAILKKNQSKVEAKASGQGAAKAGKESEASRL
jgi:cytochrome c-type biogenesis protein CcmH/NrfG